LNGFFGATTKLIVAFNDSEAEIIGAGAKPSTVPMNGSVTIFAPHRAGLASA
jgi:hypothetical protein